MLALRTCCQKQCNSNYTYRCINADIIIIYFLSFLLFPESKSIEYEFIGMNLNEIIFLTV